MEAAGLAIGILSLYKATIEILDRVDAYKTFGAESQISLVHFEAAKVRLHDWADQVGLRNGRLVAHHSPLLDEPKRAMIVQMALESLMRLLDEVEDASSSLKLPARRPTAKADLWPTALDETRKKPERHQAISKMGRISWAMGGREKLDKKIAVLEGLVNVLFQVAAPGDVGAGSWIPAFPSDGHESSSTASEAALKGLQTSLVALDRKDILEWLDALKYDDEHEKQLSLHLSGTCEWVTRHPSFLAWLSDQALDTGAEFLWIHGPAGFGKTVLSAWLIRYCRETLKLPVACCFSSSHAQRTEDFDSIVRTWITQLAQSSIDVLSRCQIARHEHSGRRASRGVIWSLLKQVLIQAPSCILALDGLDEFRDLDESRTLFLEDLKRAVASTRVKILVTSRNDPDIEAQLNASVTQSMKYTMHECTLTNKNVASDLGLYSQDVVAKKFPRQAESYRDEISAQLADRADGMFLWIKLQQSQLRGSQNRKTVQSIVQGMPHGLDQTYERNWKAIQELSEQDRNRTVDILRWLTFAIRPLTVEELVEALVIGIDEDGEVFCEDDLPSVIDTEYINDEIKGLCRSFIDIQDGPENTPGSNTVHLAHASVREYLITILPLPLNIGPLLSHGTTVTAHHALLSLHCLRYLNHLGVWHIGRDIVCRSFTVYAIYQWFIHVQRSCVNSQYHDSVSALLHCFLCSANCNFKLWQICFEMDELEHDDRAEEKVTDDWTDGDENTGEAPAATPQSNPSATYYACMFELYPIIDILLNNDDEDFSSVGGPVGTPLQVACLLGIEPMFERLMRCGADVTVQGRNGTAIRTAAQMGRSKMTKCLLERENLTAQARSRILEAVEIAAAQGHLEIVELLLDGGAIALSGPESHQEKLKTLSNGLTRAAYHGHLNMVSFLLDQGADINVRWQLMSVGLILTPLQAAVINSQLRVVTELIERGANVELRGQNGYTHLHYSAVSGNTAIAAYLLSHGADLNAKDDSGFNVLQLAALFNDLDVVRLLLDDNADVNMAIHIAADHEFTDVLICLIQNGADVNSKDDLGQTPLHVAISGGHYAASEILLQRGADVDATGAYGITPMHLLVKTQDKFDGQQYLTAIRLLIDHGADLNHPDHGGETPIIHALRCSNIVALKIFISEAGCDVDIKNRSGDSPLFIAIQYGSEEVIDDLIQRGANLSALDDYGMTCLDWVKRQRPCILESEGMHHRLSDPAIEHDVVAIQRKAIERIERIALPLKANTNPYNNLYSLCTAFLLLDMERDALLAYQLNFLVDREVLPTFCDGCKTHQTGDAPFYKCKLCPEMDLCQSCLATYKERPPRNLCQGHDFLRAVASEARITPDQPEAVQAWLLGIVERLNADFDTKLGSTLEELSET
ncbi:MAG: hypothetical protein Q9168_004871 [Polycauliona sp. 1 TL-2023]